MTTNFDRALALTLAYEGGFSENPNDHGGATMKGVTQHVYDTYRTAHHLTTQSVKLIGDDELHAIYRVGYWEPAGCDQMAWPLCAAVFDWAVNSGVQRAVSELQLQVGVAADGQFGPNTLAAIDTVDAQSLVEHYLKARRDFYHMLVARNSTQSVFLSGWLKRVDQLAAALT